MDPECFDEDWCDDYLYDPPHTANNIPSKSSDKLSRSDKKAMLDSLLETSITNYYNDGWSFNTSLERAVHDIVDCDFDNPTSSFTSDDIPLLLERADSWIDANRGARELEYPSDSIPPPPQLTPLEKFTKGLINEEQYRPLLAEEIRQELIPSVTRALRNELYVQEYEKAKREAIADIREEVRKELIPQLTKALNSV